MCASFEVMKLASAVKVIARIFAPTADRDPQCVLSKSIFNLSSSHAPQKSSVVRARHICKCRTQGPPS